MCGTVMRGADALPGSKATSRAKGSHRNLGGLGSGRQMLRERDGPHREGEEPKPMMHGHEKSDLVIVAVKPTNKARKAPCGGVCRGGRSGVGGAKGGGQGEYAPAKHVLDFRTRLACHRRWSVYGNLCRHTPEAGAVCGKAARTDLGGGRAMKCTSLPLLQRREFITLLGGRRRRGRSRRARSSRRSCRPSATWVRARLRSTATGSVPSCSGCAFIVTTGGGVPAVKQATSAIPVVFPVAGAPVGGGFVATLARPGGNVTGLSLQQTDIASKQAGASAPCCARSPAYGDPHSMAAMQTRCSS